MKNWIKTNLSKITFALAGVSLIIATTGLVLGAQSHSKTKDLQYFLDYNYEAHWGATIWATEVSNEHKILLYFKEKPKNIDDIKWNGIYPKGYFNN